jgi:hypothetical protein
VAAKLFYWSPLGVMQCTKNCLVALNKLHKTLVASVDEINGQQILHHPYIIVCHMYITIKTNNLNNDTWLMKKV